MSALATMTALPATPVLEEVVVRGEMRTAGLLETATATSVIDPATLQARSARHFEDVIDVVPNLNYAGGTGRARFFQIRGIGERSQFSEPINPSVGIIVDGIDFSGAGGALTLLDVDQVEVLRGPQGSRYGANALAGLIHVRSADPTSEPAARLEAGIAQWGGRTLAGIFSGPVNENVGARLAVQQHDSDGYYDNAFLGIDDNNRRDELTARLVLAFEPSPRHSARLTLLHLDADNGYDAFTLDNSRTTLSDEPGFDRQRTSAISLATQHRYEHLELELLGHFAASDLDYGFDEDWTYTGIHPFGYTSTDQYFRDRDTASVEARLGSAPTFTWGSRPGHWLVGLYHLRSRTALLRRYTFAAGPIESDNDFDSTAAFADLGADLGARWRIGGGLRLERRASAYRDSDGLAFDPAATLWGGHLDLKFDLDADTLLFVRLARGYKAGGVNADGSLPAELREFGAESLWEASAGVKGLRLDGRLELQLTLFHSWRRDQQARNSLVLPRPDGSTEFVDFLDNAAAGTNAGAEFEARWQFAPGLQIRVAAGWLDATFDDYVNIFGENLSGRQQAQAPDFTYSIAFDGARGPWFARLGLDGRDAFFFSDRHSVRASSRHLLNARLGWRSAGWSVSLWGRNLTDRDYTVRGFGTFGNDPRTGYVTEPYVQFGEPRVLGIDLRYELGAP